MKLLHINDHWMLVRTRQAVVKGLPLLIKVDKMKVIAGDEIIANAAETLYELERLPLEGYEAGWQEAERRLVIAIQKNLAEI